MTARMSCLLVIDASIMRSAGETEDPVSSACREALLSVLRICHRVALTAAIRNEWSRHMSRFSRKWWRSMAAHHKTFQDVVPVEVDVDTTGLSDTDRTAIEKDMCLIEAALSADCIILSRDDIVRQALAKTKDGSRLLQSIKWINPVKDGTIILETL